MIAPLESITAALIELVNSYGYLGVFLSLLASNATILLPIPGILVIFLAGTYLNPFLVGAAGALGAAFGELTGYAVGAGGRRLFEDKLELRTARKVYNKYGLWTIYLFSAGPLPFDVVGVICGMLRVDLRLFFTLTFAGKATQYMVYANGGRGFSEIASELISGHLNGFSVTAVVLAVVFLGGLALYWKSLLRKELAEERANHLVN